MKEVLFDSFGVRYNGNITFQIANDNNMAKPILNIDVNEHVNQEILGHTKIKLRDLYNYPTFVREAAAYRF